MSSALPLRIAMIGAGGVATRHVQTLTTFADVEVVAIADTDASRACALAGTCRAAAYADPALMLDVQTPDAVYICVPPFAHGCAELSCIDRRIPFFVEKPLSVTLAVAEQIAAAVEEAGLITATGYHWRYADTVTEAAQILAANLPRAVIGSWLDKVPPPSWWVHRQQSGGQVVEQLTHVLDLIRVLVGEVEAVQALSTNAPRPDHPDSDIDDVTVAILRMAGGAIGSLTASSLLRHKHRAGLEIVAEGLVLDITESELTVTRDGVPSSRSPGSDPKIAVDRAFIDAVAGLGADVRAPYAEALRTHRLGLAIVASSATGRAVRLTPDGHSNAAELSDQGVL